MTRFHSYDYEAGLWHDVGRGFLLKGFAADDGDVDDHDGHDDVNQGEW